MATFAKYSSRCTVCGQTILKGAPIGFVQPEGQGWKPCHQDCRPAPVRVPSQDLGINVAGIFSLLSTAKGKLKSPRIEITSETVGFMKFYVAGPRSKNCGDVMVIGAGTYPNNAYFGRISPDGVFHPGKSSSESAINEIKALAADPAGYAAAYGKRTGGCCFCNTSLGEGEDKRSLAIGYGPTCAKNWGLPWGTKVAEEATQASLEIVQEAAVA